MGPLLILSPVPRNIPFGLSGSPKRGVSVSYCNDNAVKQTTCKFTGYKSKHLYFLFMCLSAGPRFGSRLQWTHICSPFLHILQETSANGGMLFPWQMPSTWEMKPNCASIFKTSAHITSCLFTFHWVKQVRWPSPKWLCRKGNTAPWGKGKWLDICWIIFQSITSSSVRTSKYESVRDTVQPILTSLVGRNAKSHCKAWGHKEQWRTFCYHLPQWQHQSGSCPELEQTLVQAGTPTHVA